MPSTPDLHVTITATNTFTGPINALLDETSTFSQTVTRLGRQFHQLAAHGPVEDTDYAKLVARLHAAADRVVPPVEHGEAEALLTEEIKTRPVNA